MRYVKASNLDGHDRRRFDELRRDGESDAAVEKEFNDFIDSIACTTGLKFQLSSRGNQLVRSKKRCDSRRFL